MSIFHIYCDGACLPVNPGGVATWAFIVKSGNAVIEQQYGVAVEGPNATNNVAEYAAVGRALGWAVGTVSPADRVIVYSDSQLVIYQLTGKYSVKKLALIVLWQHCRHLISQLGTVEFRWIPREENEEADALTLQAYREHQQTTNPSHTKDTTMRMNDAFPSKYLKAEDVKTTRIVTISGARQEEVGQQRDMKMIAYFHNEPKGFVLGKTVWAQIAYVVGSDDTDHWVGKQIELYQELVRNPQGQLVPGLRVRAPQQPAHPQQQFAPQQAPPQQQQYAPQQGAPVQQPRPGMAPPNAVTDEIIEDPGDPMAARQRQAAGRF